MEGESVLHRLMHSTGFARVALVSVLLIAAPRVARAGEVLVADWWIDWEQNVFDFPTDPINFLNDVSLGFRPRPFDGSMPTYTLFENVTITTGSIGTAFVANAANDPDFAGVANTLTNGRTDDGINLRTGYILPGSAAAAIGFPLEAQMAAPTGALADFSGMTMTKIELFVEAVQFFPQPDNTTHFTLNRHLRIYADIPEPTTAAMMGIASIPFLTRRARRR